MNFLNPIVHKVFALPLHNPAVPFLGIHSSKMTTYIHINTMQGYFEKFKLSKYPSSGKCINHEKPTMEYQPIMKRAADENNKKNRSHVKREKPDSEGYTLNDSI